MRMELLRDRGQADGISYGTEKAVIITATPFVPTLVLCLDLVVAPHSFGIGRWWAGLGPSLAIASSSTLLRVIRRLRRVLPLALLIHGTVGWSLGRVVKRLV